MTRDLPSLPGIYMTRDLPCVAIHQNNYRHNRPQDYYAGKCKTAKYIVLSVIMYFAGIGMPKKVDDKYMYAASN